MPRQSITGKLAAVTVRQSKPKDKPYKLSDGVVYPNVSMTDARDKVLEAKKTRDHGIDPGIQKKQIKASNKHDTLEPIAEEWHMKESGRWSEGHSEQVWQVILLTEQPIM